MPAIRLLEDELEEKERNLNALLSTINMLRERAGLEPRQRGTGGEGKAAVASGSFQIKPDTFYGKKLQTAVREYLEMRKAQGMGPAKPREIYDAITGGGFQFEASSPEIALVGLRALLRKRTNFFHKLPNGTYGMTAWYPHARPARGAPLQTSNPPAPDEEIEDEGDPEEFA